MNGGTFSRADLQSLPQKLKKEQANNIVSSFAQSVINAASTGKKFYHYEMKNQQRNSFQVQQEIQLRAAGHYIPTTPTAEELIEVCKERFPGCSISYQEVWVERENDTKQLKKGILIDWS